MKHRISTRVFSVLLVIALLVSSCPFAYAAEEDEAGEPEAVVIEQETPTEPSSPSEPEPTDPEPSEETEPTEVTESSEVTEPSEVTDPTEETEPTEVTEPSEVTDPTEVTDPSEETEPTEETEETEPVELPYGFAGLPEGYVLSSEDLAYKLDMADHDVAQTTASLNPGTDYEDGVLMLSAGSEEEAQLFAEAFSAELVAYTCGMAKIRLQTATVSEAVSAAQDMDLPLPAAYPNHIIHLAPVAPSQGGASAFNAAPPRAADLEHLGTGEYGRSRSLPAGPRRGQLPQPLSVCPRHCGHLRRLGRIHRPE